MSDAQGDLETVLSLDVDDPEVVGQLKRVYVNVHPDHFIDAASANRVEGELRVLGAVAALVPDGQEGYLSAEDWLLHGWEYMMRRMAMMKMDKSVKDLFAQLDLGLTAEDVHSYITGPAVVIDAIALY